MYPNINNLSACACNGVCATSVRVHGQTDVNSSRKHSDRVETKPASLCAHSIINRDVITLSRAYRAYRPGQTIANANHPWLVLFPSCSGEHDPSAGAFQLFSRRGVLFDSMRWTNTRDRSDTGRTRGPPRIRESARCTGEKFCRGATRHYHPATTDHLPRFKRTPSPTAISIGPDSPGEFIRPTPSPYKFPIP